MSTEATALAKYLSLTMFVAAARYDANEDQLARLRSEILPVFVELAEKKTAGDQVRATILHILRGTQAIMGKDWVPNDEYLAQINALLGKG